eukprot:TRINITY_DN995_c0_g1_i1.p1 TRINITY_DN995_c0_g1~~TRINITY_DN995_c0_g1_i1.p1  ORF type:complete len:133 (-),score=70.37 TRINITY_DN995_c0_g1_i1:59-457(-)
MRTAHDFDLIALRAEWKLDLYATIKLINYMRSCVAVKHCCPMCSVQCDDLKSLVAHITDNKHATAQRDAAFWTDDFYLIPTIENDPLLRAPHLFAGDDESWSDDEEELQAAREEALSRQKELFASLRAAGAM